MRSLEVDNPGTVRTAESNVVTRNWHVINPVVCLCALAAVVVATIRATGGPDTAGCPGASTSSTTIAPAALPFDLAFKALAKKLDVSPQLGEDGELKVVGHGIYGRVFMLTESRVMKVHAGEVGPEEVLTANIPVCTNLVRCLEYAQVELEVGGRFTGEVMPFIKGIDAKAYGNDLPYLTNEQAISIAADLVVAIHALHTKIQGYVVLHCDIVPKNIMIERDAEGNPEHAVLLDYGEAVVHQLREGEIITEQIIPNMSTWRRCRGTSWDGWNGLTFQEHWYRPNVPYSPMVEWRELGIMIFRLVQTGHDIKDDFDVLAVLFQYTEKDRCDYKCSAKKVLQNLDGSRLAGPLKEFVEFLMFEHENIHDEVTEVLGHAVFSSLQPSPMERASGIEVKHVSTTFDRTFGETQSVSDSRGKLFV